MSQTHEEIVRDITAIIHDYRAGEAEIQPITNSHVNRWIDQFYLGEREQAAVLLAVKQWFQKYYYSKDKIKNIVSSFLSNEKIWGSNPKDKIKISCFLNAGVGQKYGESQLEMLALVDEILNERYGFSISDCNSQASYVYIDDCLFSGNRLRHEVGEWIKNAPEGVNLLIYYVAVHLRNITYVKKAIKEEAEKKKINVTWEYNRQINDINLEGADRLVEFCWPKKVDNDPQIEEYFEIICKRFKNIKIGQEKTFDPKKIKFFRPDDFIRQERIFSSSETRNIVETAFLKEGVNLTLNHILKADYSKSFKGIARDLDANKIYFIRPLGYDQFESFGFGSLFITYRNIANNCPLVLWFECLQNSWYPLFRRKPLIW